MRPSPRRNVAPADERERPAGGLAEDELRGRGQLVGDGADRRAHDPAVGVGLAAQVVERQQAGHADRDVDDAPAATAARSCRDTMTGRSWPSRSRIGRADAVAPRRPGRAAAASRSTRTPGPTLEASMPPLAQTKPWWVSVMITPLAIRTTRCASRSTTSTWRGSRS